MKRLILVMFTCLVAQTAWAGWVVTYEDAETGEKSHEYFEDARRNAGGQIITANRLISVDPGSKAYWSGKPDQFCKAIKAQMQKMQAATAAMYATHPEYKPIPISRQEVTREKIGTDTIAGFSATGYAFLVDGINSGEVWVSKDPGLSDLISLQTSMAKMMENHMRCMKDLDDQDSGLQASALYKKTVKNAVILKESYRQVVSIEQKNVPANRFEAPGGYKAFSDYPQFMDYVSNNSGSSSRGPASRSVPSFDMPAPQRSSPAQDEAQASSREDTGSSEESADKGQESKVDGVKKGAEKLLKSFGGLFGE